MNNWSRQRINPVEYLSRLGVDCTHIDYDPRMRKGEYYIVRGAAHDGTYLFTSETIWRALEPLATKGSYFKPRETEYRAAKDVRYVVGPMRLSTVYGMVNLRAGRYPGQRERVRIPVRMICQ